MRRGTTDAGRQAASQVFHEVYTKDGQFLRRFTSIISAERYARTVGGSVKKGT